MTIKKHILKNNSVSNIYSLGISTSDNEFQISLKLNECLSIQLSITTPFIKESKNNQSLFPVFLHSNEESFQAYLIKNKHQQNIAFNNYKSFDFILLLMGEDVKKKITTFKEKIKEIENVSIINEIETSKLSGLKNTF